jgi:hypothetical protein
MASRYQDQGTLICVWGAIRWHSEKTVNNLWHCNNAWTWNFLTSLNAWIYIVAFCVITPFKLVGGCQSSSRIYSDCLQRFTHVSCVVTQRFTIGLSTAVEASDFVRQYAKFSFHIPKTAKSPTHSLHQTVSFQFCLLTLMCLTQLLLQQNAHFYY